MSTRIRVASLAAACVVSVLFSVPAQEKREAESNDSFVRLAAPAERRRLLHGLELLRAGDAEQALERLLPALVAAKAPPQLPWGTRETRAFDELLLDHLRAAKPATRQAFTGRLQKDAAAALGRAGADRRVLRAILAAFPATDAAIRARRRLVDFAIEEGDWVAAASWAARLPPDKTRAATIHSLAEASLAGSPWPYTGGGVDGLPRPKVLAKPKLPQPTRIGQWPLRGPFLGPLAGGVVGRDASGNELAVFQDPIGLLIVRGNGERPALERLDLARLTSKPPSLMQRAAHPCILGTRLFVVHGTTRGTGGAEAGGAELLCMERSKESEGFAIAWRWSPDLAKARLFPAPLATERRCFVMFSVREDRLHQRVSVACVDRHGKSLWSRFVAKGSPITGEPLLFRQEAVQQAPLRPAPCVLAGGRLIVATGVGVLAALDPLDGKIVWTFKTARLKALGTTRSAWSRARLAATGGLVYATPSDSTWSYRLRLHPGLADVLDGLPTAKRNLAQFLGVVPRWNASYWMRMGLRETGPLRYLLARETGRPERYDAPPLQPDERLEVPPLLTERTLVIATNRTLYTLDLERDLYYERAFELTSPRRAGFGPAVPFDGGVLFASAAGPLLWR